MLDAIKKLLDSNVINEDTHSEIQEAWDSKLNEAKDSIKAEIREEFARRYNHDKKVMVEALNKMVTSGLKRELREFAEDRKSLRKERVEAQTKLREHATKFNNFMTAKLAEEIKELREDRKTQAKQLKLLEGFVSKRLRVELREFATDKRDLLETKVKLVSEANAKLNTLKQKFITENSKKVKAHVTNSLKSELTSLNEDIKSARQNSFGRRIFEAFANEFTSTHLNENAVVRKLQAEIQKNKKTLSVASNNMKKMKQIAESKATEVRILKESTARNELLDELLSPLSEDKKEVMQNLLENVQTTRLSNVFEKYLPAVLDNKVPKSAPVKKSKLNESVSARTGDKTVTATNDNSNIVDIKRLAGL